MNSLDHLACLQVVPHAPPNKYYLPLKWDEVLQCWEAVDSSTQTLLSMGRSHVRTPFGAHIHFTSAHGIAFEPAGKTWVEKRQEQTEQT